MNHTGPTLGRKRKKEKQENALRNREYNRVSNKLNQQPSVEELGGYGGGFVSYAGPVVVFKDRRRLNRVLRDTATR